MEAIWELPQTADIPGNAGLFEGFVGLQEIFFSLPHLHSLSLIMKHGANFV